MAAITVTSTQYGVDMAVTYVFTTAADGDTLNIGKGKTSVQYSLVGNPGTQAAAGTAFEYVSSTGVLTVRPGTDSLGGQIRVYPK